MAGQQEQLRKEKAGRKNNDKSFHNLRPEKRGSRRRSKRRAASGFLAKAQHKNLCNQDGLWGGIVAEGGFKDQGLKKVQGAAQQCQGPAGRTKESQRESVKKANCKTSSKQTSNIRSGLVPHLPTHVHPLFVPPHTK